MNSTNLDLLYESIINYLNYLLKKVYTTTLTNEELNTLLYIIYQQRLDNVNNRMIESLIDSILYNLTNSMQSFYQELTSKNDNLQFVNNDESPKNLLYISLNDRLRYLL